NIDGRIGARQNINLQDIANSRATVGMFGSGFIEMLARQMTRELQAIRDTIASGGSASLVAKGISFGVLSRRADGAWNISGVEGIPAVSLVSAGASQPPSLVIRPFHQAGRVGFTPRIFQQRLQPSARHPKYGAVRPDTGP